ncbi:MAG: SPFH domain-containing protein [Planctomycetota bacterium]
MNEHQDHIDTGGPLEEMPVETPRRAASVTLRGEDARVARAVSMEAANQSLADALRILYYVLLFSLALMVVLFVMSGARTIEQGESGIRVRFGKIVESGLTPGLRFNLPRPVGEIITIGSGDESVEVRDAFWDPVIDPDQVSGGPPGRNNLRPGREGSMITNDLNLVHARWKLDYTRSQADRYLENIHPDHEASLVRALVQRAAVHGVAQTPIDALIGSGDQRSQALSVGALETSTRAKVQDSFEALDLGLRALDLRATPLRAPQRVNREFQQVLTAQQQSSTQLENARRSRTEQLNQVAGSAHEPLLALIEEYERVLETGGVEAGADVLDTIRAVFDGEFDGRTLEVNGEVFEGFKIGGSASETIVQAEQYRTTIRRAAQSRADDFLAKLSNYRANPKLTLVNEMTGAIQEFLGRETTETFWLPGGSDLRMLLTPDPEWKREIERAVRRRDVEQNEARRNAFNSGTMRE